MEVIVISSKEKFKSEVPHVCRMLGLGLDTFHLRKPNFSEERMTEYLKEIPEQYHNRIVVHSFHHLAKKFNLKGIHYTKRHKKKKNLKKLKATLFRIFNPNLIITTSCHDLFKIQEYSKKHEYIFLSPIFDSISKGGHHGAFSLGTVKRSLTECENNVYALGGVESSNVEEVRRLGFKGVALLGTLWNTKEDPVEVYQQIVDIAEGRRAYNTMEIKTVKINM